MPFTYLDEQPQSKKSKFTYLDEIPNNPVGLPNKNQTENAISQRSSAIRDVQQSAPKSFKELGMATLKRVVNPIGSIADDAGKVAGAGFEMAEGIPSSIGLDLQHGNVKDIPRNIAKVAAGSRPAQAGDLVRTTGFGGDMNEPIARTVGLFGTAGLANIASRGNLAKEASKTAKLSKDQIGGLRQVQTIVKTMQNIKDPSNFAKVVRRSLFKKKQEVGKDFEKAIDTLVKDNPDQAVDLSGPFQYLKDNVDNIQDNPGLRREINSVISRIRNKDQVKLLRELIDDPMKASQLTLKQAQDIKVAIQQSPSISRKLNQGKFADYSSGDMELLDLLDEVKVAQSEAFPQMAAVRRPYAEYMQNYSNVKNLFKPGKTIKRLQEGFGDEEVQKMIKAVLPEETFGDIARYRRTIKGINFGLKAAGVGLAIEGGRRGLNMLQGN